MSSIKSNKNNLTYFKVIAQDHFNPGDIQFKIKLLKTDEVKTVPIKDLFYQDKWLSGFGLDDVRMIAKVYAQSEWYRDKKIIAGEFEDI